MERTSSFDYRTGMTERTPFDRQSQRLARPILVSFLFTFIAARVLVFLIVARRIPDLYVHLGGTHIHHLNYGIFLLSGIMLVESFKYADRLLLRIQIIEQSRPPLR